MTAAADIKSVIWIASYPKSGNTWLRFLVCNLLFGPQDSAAALNHLAPDIHELAGTPLPPQEITFLKTHYPHSSRMPLAAHTAAVLYIVRHPADVLLSNHHYSHRRGGVAGLDLKQYVERYLSEGGDPHWTELGIGPWSDHVRSWLALRSSVPLLLLRYEDLIEDCAASARQICTFLGLQRSASEVTAAIEGSSFERMRQIEADDIAQRRVGIFYKPYLQSSIDSGVRFMRAGRAGQAREALSPAQRSRVEAAFGPVMRELGYELRDGG